MPNLKIFRSSFRIHHYTGIWRVWCGCLHWRSECFLTG